MAHLLLRTKLTGGFYTCDLSPCICIATKALPAHADQYPCANCKASAPLHGQDQQAGRQEWVPSRFSRPRAFPPQHLTRSLPATLTKEAFAKARQKSCRRGKDREGMMRHPQIRGYWECNACMARKWKMNLLQGDTSGMLKPSVD